MGRVTSGDPGLGWPQLSALQVADANGQQQSLCAVWQALPENQMCPWEEGLPLERSLAPSSSPLLFLPPPQDQAAPWTPSVTPDCPRARKNPCQHGLPGSSRPSVLGGAQETPSTVRHPQGWVPLGSPLLVWLSHCCPGLMGNRTPPAQVHLASFTCVLHLSVPVAGSWLRTGPWSQRLNVLPQAARAS